MPLAEDPLVRFYLRLIAANVVLTIVIVGAALALWFSLRESAWTMEEIATRTCKARVLTTRDPHAPSHEAVSHRAGMQLPKDALLAELDLVQDGHPERRKQLSDPAALRPSTIHIVNLWAPWCEPCLRELPGLQQLFAAKASAWKGVAEFIPIKVLDHTNPSAAYATFKKRLPASRVGLADRSEDDRLVSALRESQIYHGRLPVTFVLDCNRQVRWIHHDELGPSHLAELAEQVDALIAELPSAECKRPICGNGRCEGREAFEGSSFCDLDCSEARVIASPVPAPLLPPDPNTSPPAAPPPAAPPCPPECLCDEQGTCISRLQGDPKPRAKQEEEPEPIQPGEPRCGDGTCDSELGEDSASCCRDCPCVGTFTCEQGDDDKYRCIANIH